MSKIWAIRFIIESELINEYRAARNQSSVRKDLAS